MRMQKRPQRQQTHQQADQPETQAVKGGERVHRQIIELQCDPGLVW